jgi:hypothetical protein
MCQILPFQQQKARTEQEQYGRYHSLDQSPREGRIFMGVRKRSAQAFDLIICHGVTSQTWPFFAGRISCHTR